MTSLRFGVIAITVLATAASPMATAVAAKYYNVTVYTNINYTFNDCFAFTGGFQKGTLAVAGLPASMLYTVAPPPARDYYTAVSNNAMNQSIGGTIAFSGVKMGAPGTITFTAVGSNSERESYFIIGTETTTPCTSQGVASTVRSWMPKK